MLHVLPVYAVVGDHADAPAFVEAEDALATQTEHQLPQVPSLSGEEDQVALRRRRQRDAGNRRQPVRQDAGVLVVLRQPLHHVLQRVHPRRAGGSRPPPPPPPHPPFPPPPPPP